MNNNYQCPYCHSSKVQDRITEIQCLDCGSIDILEDSTRVIYLPEEPPRPDPMPYERKVIRIHHVRSNTVLYPRIGQLHNELDEVRDDVKGLKAYLKQKEAERIAKKKDKYTIKGGGEGDII